MILTFNHIFLNIIYFLIQEYNKIILNIYNKIILKYINRDAFWCILM